MTSPTVHPYENKPIKWPDRSHRTLAEVWKLSAEEVKAEQFVDLRPQEWRRG